MPLARGAGLAAVALAASVFSSSPVWAQSNTIAVQSAVASRKTVASSAVPASAGAAAAAATQDTLGVSAGSAPVASAPGGPAKTAEAPASFKTASFDQATVRNILPPSELTGARAAVSAEVKTLFPMTLRERRIYERASSEFPAFCHDWERKLHDREVNNLANIAWSARGGYETATYVGYSSIERCECHESRQGIPIGKVTYEEINYYLVGKTLDEAKHAKPRQVGVTNTLEIFSWERNKWFY
jgi:hypothetical protein